MADGRRPGRKSLSEVLLEGAFVRPEELAVGQEISQRTGKRLGAVLVEQNYLTQETLATVLSFQYGVPIIDLQQFQIQREAVDLVPESLVQEHSILPLSVEDDVITVAMEDPENLDLLDRLTSVTGRRVRAVIPLHGGIAEGIAASYRLTSGLAEKMQESSSATPYSPGQQSPLTDSVPSLAAQLQIQEPGLAAASGATPAERVSQSPVVRALDLIISQALRDRASDIHIQPQADGVKVRYRVDGILHDIVNLPSGVHTTLVSRIKVMSNMNIAEKRRPQDGQFSTTVGDRDVDIRVATAATNYGEMAVLRVLDKSLSVLKLSEVGLSPENIDMFERMLQSAFGMVLVSGPTGSGKTTTLYAAVNEINAEQKNIITIEDPIEYQFPRINQLQVNAQAGLTFASGLRSIMRLDPDIILVGEIRDRETAETAVQAALTGHLVFSSIHANDAAGAIVRLIDLGVEPFLVTSAVLAATSQRLVRRVCPYCSQTRPALPPEAMAYQEEMEETRTQFTSGRGCNLCSHTGYLGRTGVHEILPMTDRVRRLTGDGASASDIKAEAVATGMVTMRRDGMLKAGDGVTTPQEVIRNVFTIG